MANRSYAGTDMGAAMKQLITPLNGTKTHPLSEHAIGRLRDLAKGPIPVSEVNPGVINRLQRDDFAEVVQLPSPFKTHRGKNIGHVQITQAGMDFLAGLDGNNGPG